MAGIAEERRRKRAQVVPNDCGVGDHRIAGCALGDDRRERVTFRSGSDHATLSWLRRTLGLSLLGPDAGYHAAATCSLL